MRKRYNAVIGDQGGTSELIEIIHAFIFQSVFQPIEIFYLLERKRSKNWKEEEEEEVEEWRDTLLSMSVQKPTGTFTNLHGSQFTSGKIDYETDIKPKRRGEKGEKGGEGERE